MVSREKNLLLSIMHGLQYVDEFKCEGSMYVIGRNENDCYCLDSGAGKKFVLTSPPSPLSPHRENIPEWYKISIVNMPIYSEKYSEQFTIKEYSP